jgi:NADPH-dependent glutamate synthase beta subunit-like oxidoreductase
MLVNKKSVLFAWVPPPKFEAILGSEFSLDVDLVLMAMGFTGPVKSGLIEQLGVNLDARGNVATDANYMSTSPGFLLRAQSCHESVDFSRARTL